MVLSTSSFRYLLMMNKFPSSLPQVFISVISIHLSMVLIPIYLDHLTAVADSVTGLEVVVDLVPIRGSLVCEVCDQPDHSTSVFNYRFDYTFLLIGPYLLPQSWIISHNINHLFLIALLNLVCCHLVLSIHQSFSLGFLYGNPCVLDLITILLSTFSILYSEIESLKHM